MEPAVIVKISLVVAVEPSKVRPPLKVRAVEVEAPRPVTVAKVSASEVITDHQIIIFLSY